MTYAEFLIRKCEALWAQGRRLPLDLFSQCISAGLDIGTIERKYMEQHANG